MDFSESVNPINLSDDGRIVAVDVDFFGNRLRILSVYAPNVPADRKFFFSNLSDHLSMSHHNIVGGASIVLIQLSSILFIILTQAPLYKALRNSGPLWLTLV